MVELVFAIGLSFTVADVEPDWFPGPDEEVLRGDANNDGMVSVSDPTYIQNFLFEGGNTPPCMTAADANDDGQVDNSDAVYLYEFLFLGGSNPPAPYPYCGSDPTQDQLTCATSACS
jgi:hypothetical protein